MTTGLGMGFGEHVTVRHLCGEATSLPNPQTPNSSGSCRINKAHK